MEKLVGHEASLIHKECMIKWKMRIQTIKTGMGIDKELEKLIQSEKEKWRESLHIIADAILYLSTNCLSSRGSSENITGFTKNCPSTNRGNFLNLIVLLAKHRQH